MENDTGKKLIQAAITIAVVAFVLSFSRMFLTVAERSSQAADMYVYDLSQNGTLGAFIAIALASIVAIVLGALLSKSLDIIGTPLIAGGAMALIYTSIGSYLLQSLGNHGTGSHGFFQPNTVLLFVFAFELAALIVYAEMKFPNTESIPDKSPSPTQSTNPASTDQGVK